MFKNFYVYRRRILWDKYLLISNINLLFFTDNFYILYLFSFLNEILYNFIRILSDIISYYIFPVLVDEIVIYNARLE